ncbi:glucosamine-6-phosphate deaminase [Synoicihabitans lomoniglobus]|uniref:Glucosamine-6-phosphate deaminase n=1 Tax=Synoicihabitans lomoniglobus TaxID=2909285 RepID=A0AAF0A1M6_9BACT|nr:glucosamine-6-phosphate deaminase [Opitutaceae bacterium LMO-M01]WED65167.1 glucosamine-6-phosphate deaminase [Opitutaceae bacterium LMO-M01]
MEIIIQKTPDAGCLLGAKIMAKKVREKPDAVLGLATGRTPERLYGELVRMHREEGLDFSQVTTFNLDEYVGLSPDHPQSYRRFMNEHLFDHINIDLARTHVPAGDAADLQAECRAYEQRIAAAGGIDLQLLGLGRNGHIGFNEPTGSLRSRTWIKILSEQTLEDNSAVFGDMAAMPRHAISMGIGTIIDARQIVLLAFGPAKVRAVMDMIEGPLAAVCPGSALQQHPRATVVLDEASAGGLRYADHYRWVDSHKLAWQRYD